MHQKFIHLILLIFLFAVSNSQASISEPDKQFPVYDAIRPNVAFWKSVYSQYNSRQGIVHDTDNLNVIYEIIDLEPRTSRSARRRNIRLIRETKACYAALLKRLARNPLLEDENAQRVKKMFGDQVTSSELSAAASRIRLQRGQKNFFRDGLVRSGQYRDAIKSIFKKHNLPTDLIFLPHVESSFNFNAYSKFGAAGIWQFTYRTGKRFMTVDYTVDQRWDPLIASDSAARLLKRNHQLLGSWPLALTAYNHGANAMKRAKKATGNYEKIFLEYDGRRFKFASRNFYSEFLAAREVAKNYKQYFPGLILNRPVQTKCYTTKGFISVKSLSEHLKISTTKIRSLNRSLRTPVFKDQKYIPKGFKLRLPDKPEMEKRMASIPAELFKDKQKRSRFYYVRKGDVAGTIARRHGITLQELIWANNLNRRARIYAGQNLRIPTPEDSKLLAAKYATPSPAEEQTAAKIRVRQQEDQKQTETKAVVKRPQPEVKEGEINPYIVTANIRVKRSFTRNGVNFGVIQVDTAETLGHFADWLHTSAQYIRNLNRLSFRAEIRMDQNLVIPFNRVDKEVFEEKRYEFHKEFEEDFLNAYMIEGTWNYKIRRGDNIWTLCKEQFDLPVWLVKKYNLSMNLNKLMPGQIFVVPIVEERTES